MKTLAQYEETKTLNNETGEITETSTSKIFKAEAEPNYIKLYLEDISYLNKLPKGTDSIIYELLQYINYRQEIIINSHIKKQIAENLEVGIGHINNSITTLSKQEVLIRIDRGVYQINSYIFGKGSWKDIIKHRKSLKLEIFYDYKNGKTIKTISPEENNIKELAAEIIKKAS